MRRFWNWGKNDDETRTLYLEGVIAEESWFADDVTPAMFKATRMAFDSLLYPYRDPEKMF